MAGVAVVGAASVAVTQPRQWKMRKKAALVTIVFKKNLPKVHPKKEIKLANQTGKPSQDSAISGLNVTGEKRQT
jgi:hypothetical protein